MIFLGLASVHHFVLFNQLVVYNVLLGGIEMFIVEIIDLAYQVLYEIIIRTCQ